MFLTTLIIVFSLILLAVAGIGIKMLFKKMENSKKNAL